MRWRWWMPLLIAAAFPSIVRGEDARLAARLPAPARVEVQAIADSAAAESLPSEALVQRALEGATKGADAPRIVQAVRLLFHRLRESRELLGRRASSTELVASASCLQAGADSSSIRLLRAARERGSLVVPLVVLADLIGRGTPADLASQTTLSLTRAGASDSDLLEMRKRVELDIMSGTTPVAAVTRRSRDLAPGAFPEAGERIPSPGTR